MMNSKTHAAISAESAGGPPLYQAAGRWTLYLPALVPVLLALVVALTWGTLLPHDALMALIVENGPVESLTVLLYLLVALALWCVPRPGNDSLDRAALALLLLAMAARELDLHKHFTGTSVLKVSFYLHDAPLLQKLVALPIVLAVIATAVWMAIRHAGALRRGLQRGRPMAATAAVFFVTLVVTKVFDRAYNILAEDFGLVMSVGWHGLLSALEEVGECSLPLIVAVGLGQYQRELAGAPALRL